MYRAMKQRSSTSSSLSAEWLRSRFLTGLPDVGPLEEGVPPGPLRPAAVLVPIVLREPEPTVLLTRRTDHLHHHPGQVSFPGGRVEDQDASPIDTALRETEEEISLRRTHVELLGCLPQYQTGTGFDITPVVGLVTPPFDLQLDPFEVAEVFEVPLSAARGVNTTLCLMESTSSGALPQECS